VLEELQLVGNVVGDDGACHLAAALERNKTLKSLYLDYNNIASDGARYLAAALERKSTLMELRLSSNNIADDGARHLAAALERNCTLTSLYLGDNNIAEAAEAALRAAGNQCTLDVLHGVHGVGGILKRNRRVRVACKQQAMLCPSFIAPFMFLSRCCGSARYNRTPCLQGIVSGCVSSSFLTPLNVGCSPT
jgi:hypothetical protein